MSTWAWDYPSLVVQTRRTTTSFWIGKSLIWELWLIVIVITTTHLLGFKAIITAIIPPGLIPLSDISISVGLTAFCAGVLIIADTSAAALEPATGVLIIAAHQQKTSPSGRNGSSRVDALRQSRQRHRGGGLLHTRRRDHTSRHISPSDRRFTVSSRSVGLVF